MYADAGYNAIADFAPITQIERGALLLAVNPEVPVHSVAELIALANSKPGELNYGSPGTAPRRIWPASCSIEARM
jgi:tripartite-type tricarboxylate transporter receptor subunit TctC